MGVCVGGRGLAEDSMKCDIGRIFDSILTELDETLNK